jgi:hypothetical protein
MICGLASDAAAVALQLGTTAYQAFRLLESTSLIIMCSIIDCRNNLTNMKAANPELFDSLNVYSTSLILLWKPK